MDHNFSCDRFSRRRARIWRHRWRLCRHRQNPFFRFHRAFADFACHHAKLIIEVDGDTHGTDSAVAYDHVRDKFLRNAGYELLRVSNRDVMQNLDGVGIAIEQALKGRTTLATPTRLPPPSPQGGGDPASTTETKAPSSPSPLRGGIKGGGRAAHRHGAGQRAFRKGDS